MPKTMKMTVDEFIEEYSKLPDGYRYELQDGEVLLSPEPNPYHARLQALILSLLLDYTDEHPDAVVYAPTNVALTDSTSRGPDATVTLKGDGTVAQDKKIAGTPAVLIEIVSPSNPNYDLIDKRAVYCKQRVPEIWFFDASKAEAIFLSLEGRDYAEQRMSKGIFKSKVLKDMRLDVEALFALDRKRLRKSAEL